jgi:single-strand DNA-binding protein
MSGSVNRAFLIGRCGKDPTVRLTQGGAKIVSFSVATGESWKDRSSGERKQETQWHNVVIFDTRLADVAEKFVKKGSHLVVEGTIKNRKWTDQSTGNDRYITEIVIPAFGGNLQLLTPHGSNQAPPREEAREPTRTDPKGGPQYSGSTGADLDDEIPFAPEWR